MTDKEKNSETEAVLKSSPYQLKFIKSKIKGKFVRQEPVGPIIRDREQSVTTECCAIGTMSARINNVEAENNVANTIMVANDEKATEADSMLGKTTVFKVYPERWWLLLTVVLLNLANYSHWVAFPSVAKNAAKYYDQTGESMDLIPTVSYGLGVPCCLVATYVVENYGLRTGLHIGGSLTGIGGLMCFLSSFPYLSDGISNDSKYYLALIGQALTGVACPFISCVPTKISQLWFGDDQRTLATILLGMSNPMGIVFGQGLTPLLVQSKDDVPIMNIVWFIPAGLGSLLTIWKVTANHPPSAPSNSALQQMLARKHLKYMASIKALLTNVPFIIMFFFVGGAMGYISCVSTKIEQVLCSRGYSDQLSGFAGSLILLCGTLASFPMGLLSHKTQKPILICKVNSVFVIGSMISLAYFMNVPDHSLSIVFSCIFMGIFALGVYPLALELIVECTYPYDQAIGTAFIFLSSALQGVILMLMENAFNGPLSEDEMLVQTCVGPDDQGHQQPKDYTNFLIVMNSYMTVLILAFVFFFKTEMHRKNADLSHRTETCTALTEVGSSTPEPKPDSTKLDV